MRKDSVGTPSNTPFVDVYFFRTGLLLDLPVWPPHTHPVHMHGILFLFLRSFLSEIH